jgi:hypothetical protein
MMSYDSLFTCIYNLLTIYLIVHYVHLVHQFLTTSLVCQVSISTYTEYSFL